VTVHAHQQFGPRARRQYLDCCYPGFTGFTASGVCPASRARGGGGAAAVGPYSFFFFIAQHRRRTHITNSGTQGGPPGSRCRWGFLWRSDRFLPREAGRQKRSAHRAYTIASHSGVRVFLRNHVLSRHAPGWRQRWPNGDPTTTGLATAAYDTSRRGYNEGLRVPVPVLGGWIQRSPGRPNSRRTWPLHRFDRCMTVRPSPTTPRYSMCINGPVHGPR